MASRQEKAVERRSKLLIWMFGSSYVYGYDTSRALKMRAYHLYPLLTKLMNEGLVEDAWDGAEPRRRKYRLTEAGERIAVDLLSAR